MTLAGVRMLQLPRIADPRGNLTFVEGGQHVPFKIERVYTIYNVPGGERRGGHAYRTLEEVVISLSGSFDVVLSDGRDTQRVSLARAYYGLYIPRMVWRHMENFSTNGIALVLASQHYDEADYFRDYEIFRSEAAS
ncbi:MAG TPA: FdtA/QdtA family cupin domain-containing protein [Thermoanaerobaculia bacterium]|nr:FdtA/QdtA family cupin domain-containing protein [Thermoanaerobaculia bacterium]